METAREGRPMTRLAWKRIPGYGDPLWAATVGGFTLRVRDRHDHAQWEIRIRGISGDLTDAPTVADAQAAAEEAALSLLVEAVAAFDVKAPDRYGVYRVNPVFRDHLGAIDVAHHDGEREGAFYVRDEDDAKRLGCALLCAALKARKETDR